VRRKLRERGHPRAGESGVGSDAGPICLYAGALLQARFRPIRRRISRLSHAIGTRPVPRFVAFTRRFAPDLKPRGDETLTRFAFRDGAAVSAHPMRTRTHVNGHGARSLTARSLEGLALVGLLGLLPLAASSAAAPDAAVARVDAATSAAVIELVPVQPSAEVTAPAPAREPPAPSAPQDTVIGRGSASYYATKFDGRRTASGERFDNDDMTAAHRSLPFGSLVRVTNPANGRSVVVRINDRGPFIRSRMIDLSRAAAEELGFVARGHATVELALVAD